MLWVKINDAYMENVTSHKLLGMIVDNTLSWKQQIVLFQLAPSENLHFCSK